MRTACAGGTNPDPRAPSDATGDPTDQTGDPDDQDAATGSEGDVAEDAALADDADDEPIAEVGSLALGTAMVTIGDETFEFLVFRYFLTPAEDPSGLFEFAGASAAPEVPRSEIEASLSRCGGRSIESRRGDRTQPGQSSALPQLRPDVRLAATSRRRRGRGRADA